MYMGTRMSRCPMSASKSLLAGAKIGSLDLGVLGPIPPCTLAPTRADAGYEIAPAHEFLIALVLMAGQKHPVYLRQQPYPAVHTCSRNCLLSSTTENNPFHRHVCDFRIPPTIHSLTHLIFNQHFCSQIWAPCAPGIAFVDPNAGYGRHRTHQGTLRHRPNPRRRQWHCLLARDNEQKAILRHDSARFGRYENPNFLVFDAKRRDLRHLRAFKNTINTSKTIT